MNFSRKLQIMSVLIFAGILIFSFHPTKALACEIDVKVYGESKEIYRTGDEVVLSVEVFLTHRNCPEGIEATEFKAEGMDILSATKWTETYSNHFERLVKVRIAVNESSESIFYVKRTCSKEGGYDYLKLNVDTV